MSKHDCGRNGGIILRQGQVRTIKQFKIAVLLAAVFICFVRTEGHAEIQSLNNTNPKVIYIVYDNSTSMVSDNGKNGPHTTRWVEASYAIKALATMMNKEDILRIYPISYNKSENGAQDKPSEEIKFENNSLQNILDQIENVVDGFAWRGQTYFSSVTQAAEDIRNNYRTGYDYWIVILTDGVFTDLAEEVSLKESLDAINAGARTPISIAYIYISGGSNSEKEKIEEDNKYIFVPDAEVGDEITAKMTNIANKIYKRVAIKTPEDYFVTEGQDTRIKLNIPLERVLVFTQYTGDEQLYNTVKESMRSTYESIGTDSGIRCSDGLRKLNDYTITGSCRSISRDSFKTSERDRPKLEEIKYRFIKGNMHVVTNTGSFENFKDQSVVVENFTRTELANSIDIYYKPAVMIDVSYYQDGREISHTEECENRDSGAAEACIPEGETMIQVDIMGTGGAKDKLDEYTLLYPDDFVVTLRREEENGWEDIPLGVVDSEALMYQCELEKGTYELRIVTSWNEVYVQHLEIQDKWQPVSMEFYDTQAVYLESLENPSCEVGIRAYSGGDASDEEVLAHVKDVSLEVEADNELFGVEKVGKLGNGVWLFRVTLRDTSVHDVGSNLMFNAVAETDYNTAESNEHVFSESLPVTSGEFTLSVEDEPLEAGDYFWRLFRGETLGIKYYCDGIELNEGQIQNLKVSKDYVVEPHKMKQKIKVTEDGNICLEYGPFYWFFHREDMVKTGWKVTYTRWNHEESQEVEMDIKILYLPVIVKGAIVITVLVVVVWWGLCFSKRFTDIFIHKEKVTLESSYRSQPIKMCRKGMVCIPFWKSVRIRYKDTSGYFPTVSLDIKNNPEGKGYEILNYGSLSDEKQYRLGKKRISSSNRIISDSRFLEVADHNGHWYKLVMKR